MLLLYSNKSIYTFRCGNYSWRCYGCPDIACRSCDAIPVFHVAQEKTTRGREEEWLGKTYRQSQAQPRKVSSHR